MHHFRPQRGVAVHGYLQGEPGRGRLWCVGIRSSAGRSLQKRNELSSDSGISGGGALHPKRRHRSAGRRHGGRSGRIRGGDLHAGNQRVSGAYHLAGGSGFFRRRKDRHRPSFREEPGGSVSSAETGFTGQSPLEHLAVGCLPGRVWRKSSNTG